MEKIIVESENVVSRNVEKIGALFPNCITETLGEDGKLKKAINFETLQQMLSEDVIEGDESYEFTWVGKKSSIAEANRPIQKTLRPCPEESVNWDTTENLYIEGDNLQVLKLLQKSYLGKIKMIYIDPPYNTGKDFVYNDNFSWSADDWDIKSGRIDEEGNHLFKNTESNGRFHSDWCSMIYSRLLVARSLLQEDGVIFISIDDNEVSNLRLICDDIFGSHSFIAKFPRVEKKGGKSSEVFSQNHDYVLIYGLDNPKFYQLEHNDKDFKYRDDFFETRGYYKLNQTLDYDSLQYSKSLDYPLEIDGEIFYPGSSIEKYNERKNGKYNRADWAWRWSKAKFDFGYNNGFVVVKNGKSGKRIYTKTYQNATIEENEEGYYISYNDRTKALSTLEMTKNIYSNDNAKKDLDDILSKNLFDYTKPISLIVLCALLSTKDDDLVLDFFSGSATTAHAVMQLNAEDGGNRKFIMVQIPEVCDEKSEAYNAGYSNICEIGKERIRRAGKKIKEENPLTTLDLDVGFRVLKLDDWNKKDVEKTPAETSQADLLDFTDNLRDDRSDLDLLFGCLIDSGLELTKPITSEDIEGCAVYSYNEDWLIGCFAENVPDSVIRQIASRKPRKAIFRDSSFADSPSKINVTEVFKMISPDTQLRVI